MESIDVIVYTADIRHADICEQNPFEAMQTNVFGLQNIAKMAIETGIQHVVFMSNVAPTNPAYTLFAIDLLGEKFITEANQYDNNERERTAPPLIVNVDGVLDREETELTKTEYREV